MEDLLTLEHLTSLILLIMLQAVLGLDNLLYISIASKQAPEKDQARVRTVGIAWAVLLRIGLLFLLLQLIQWFQNPWFAIENNPYFTGSFNFHSIIVLIGGVFIMYTAIKEIWHMMYFDPDNEQSEQGTKSPTQVILLIILMNLVFSFD